MQYLTEKILFALKQHTYPKMRQMAIGMTSAYLPPVVPRRSSIENPASPTISFKMKGNKRFAWHQQIVRHGH